MYIKQWAKLLLTLGFVLSTTLAQAMEKDEVMAKIDAIMPTLKSWGHNPVLIAAVQAQNAQHLKLDTIKQRDQEWMGATEMTDFMKGLMKNEAAKELSKLEKSKKYFFELFLMDNQGANVAMTNKTSDYWQGDEDKFIESYKNGAGAVHVGKAAFDKSTKTWLVQVSVPVVDQNRAIGALTIGIDLDSLEGLNKK